MPFVLGYVDCFKGFLKQRKPEEGIICVKSFQTLLDNEINPYLGILILDVNKMQTVRINLNSFTRPFYLREKLD